ncbi:MAG: DRTGG domain-containing protein [Candidatus Bipolaricaulota bacterium]
MKFTVGELIEEIEDLELLQGNPAETLQCGYVSDLLSDVMRNAESNSIWITIQHHENVIAVALMADISVVVFATGVTPGEEVLERAREEEITVCSYRGNSFDLAGKLYHLGLRSTPTQAPEIEQTNNSQGG